MTQIFSPRSAAQGTGGAAVFTLVLLLACPAIAAEQEAAALRIPNVARVDPLLLERCSQCHSARVVQVRRDGRAGWERTVRRMVLRGAQINSDAELTAMVRHLTENYGIVSGALITGPLPPNAALRSDVRGTSSSLTLPPGPGQDIVQSMCTACHDLGRVVSTPRSLQAWAQIVRDMGSRMDVTLPDDSVQTVARYLHGIVTVPNR